MPLSTNPTDTSHPYQNHCDANFGSTTPAACNIDTGEACTESGLLVRVMGCLRDGGNIAITGVLKVTPDSPLVDYKHNPGILLLPVTHDFPIANGVLDCQLPPSAHVGVTYHFEVVTSTGTIYDFHAVLPVQQCISFTDLVPTGITSSKLDSGAWQVAQLLTTNPTFQEQIRRVFVPSGDWNNQQRYAPFSLVNHKGASYISTRWNYQEEPTEDGFNPWQLLIKPEPPEVRYVNPLAGQEVLRAEIPLPLKLDGLANPTYIKAPSTSWINVTRSHLNLDNLPQITPRCTRKFKLLIFHTNNFLKTPNRLNAEYRIAQARTYGTPLKIDALDTRLTDGKHQVFDLTQAEGEPNLNLFWSLQVKQIDESFGEHRIYAVTLLVYDVYPPDAPQIDLNTYDLAKYAPLSNPNFKGSPLALTPQLTDSSQRLSTTEFVQNNITLVKNWVTQSLDSYQPQGNIDLSNYATTQSLQNKADIAYVNQLINALPKPQIIHTSNFATFDDLRNKVDISYLNQVIASLPTPTTPTAPTTISPLPLGFTSLQDVLTFLITSTGALTQKVFTKVTRNNKPVELPFLSGFTAKYKLRVYLSIFNALSAEAITLKVASLSSERLINIPVPTNLDTTDTGKTYTFMLPISVINVDTWFEVMPSNVSVKVLGVQYLSEYAKS